MKTIDRSSPIPLYRQIKDILTEEIAGSTGGDMPSITERELISRFRVSRAPIRQALKELSNEGYLYRQRGQGTFPVRGLKLNPPALQLGGLTAYLREQGLATESVVIEVGRIVPPEDVRLKLQLGRGKVFWSSRIISIQGAPLIWSRIYLDIPEHFDPSIERLQELSGVFEFLDNEPDLALTQGEHTIYASAASEEDAHALSIGEGDPVLITETVMYTRTGKLEGFRKLVQRANDYKLVFTVNR